MEENPMNKEVIVFFYSEIGKTKNWQNPEVFSAENPHVVVFFELTPLHLVVTLRKVSRL